jgi:hypothetical protein
MISTVAVLGPDLILEEDAGGARVLEVADRAQDIDGVAVARVGVDYHRRRGHAADGAGGVDHLGLGQEAKVGLAEPRRAHGVAGDEHDVEADAGGDPRGQRVVEAGHEDRAGGDGVANALGTGRHDASSAGSPAAASAVAASSKVCTRTMRPFSTWASTANSASSPSSPLSRQR